MEAIQMSKYALIVVDMLNDFVTGTLGCERGRAIVPALAELIEAARAHGIPMIYANDSHIKGIDRELELWGDHAIRGTEGAEVIPVLKPEEGDYIVPKRRYSGFYQTDLQMLLSELGVDTLIITGLHTHMCCRHTSADAYYLGLKLVVPRETTNAFTEEDYLSGLRYLKEVYGAEICDLSELLARF
jgi:nicotinamidase-related amidase